MAEDLDQVLRPPKATDPIRDRLEKADSGRSARASSSNGSRISSSGMVSEVDMYKSL